MVPLALEVAKPEVNVNSEPNTNPTLSIVLPAYNEEARIGRTLRRLNEYLSAQPYSAEVVVVDDGSRDATAEIVQRELPSARLIRHGRNRGKGAGVRSGVLAAQGKFIAFVDADLATPIEELPGLWTRLEEGADLVAGVRNWPDGRDYRDSEPPLRRAFGRVFNLAVRMLGLSHLRDTQCPFKLFRGDAARLLFGSARVDSIVFDVEILYMARLAGLRIAAVPVTWENVAGSRMRVTFNHAWTVGRDLLRIRLYGKAPAPLASEALETGSRR